MTSRSDVVRPRHMGVTAGTSDVTLWSLSRIIKPQWRRGMPRHAFTHWVRSVTLLSSLAHLLLFEHSLTWKFYCYWCIICFSAATVQFLKFGIKEGHLFYFINNFDNCHANGPLHHLKVSTHRPFVSCAFVDRVGRPTIWGIGGPTPWTVRKSMFPWPKTLNPWFLPKGLVEPCMAAATHWVRMVGWMKGQCKRPLGYHEGPFHYVPCLRLSTRG